MKRTFSIIGLAVLALAPFSTAQAAKVGVVLRPIVGYVSPDADGYDNAGYIGFAGGVAVGTTRQHEFHVETGVTGWEQKESGYGYYAEGTETYVPVLVGYRHYTEPLGSKLRLYVGPSIGLTHVLYEIEARGSGVFIKDDSNEVLFTAAANIGVEIRFNERMSLDVGYRYLYIDGGDTELLGMNVSFDDARAHIGQVGLNIRF